jgi:maltokinase-like protein
MALIYPSASLAPTKQELLDAWLPTQSWYPGGPAEKVAAYRFDDPAGEVGIEGFVLRAGDVLVHQVLTYRAEPLVEAEPWLVGTTEHSVLGTRWVYDVAGDPVGLTMLAATAVTGGRQADVVADGGTEPYPSAMTVRGSGTPGAHVGELAAVTSVGTGPVTVIHGGSQEVLLVRLIGESLPEGVPTLTGEWPGGSGVLAGARRV